MNDKIQVKINDTIAKAISKNHARQHKIEIIRAKKNSIQKNNIEKYNNAIYFILGIIIAMIFITIIHKII